MLPRDFSQPILTAPLPEGYVCHARRIERWIGIAIWCALFIVLIVTSQ